MKRAKVAPIVALVVAAVLAGLVWVLVAGGGGNDDKNGIVDSNLLDKPAPAVRTTTLDGQPFDLARRKGNWVVLNFFNSTCAPCRAEHPELVTFAEQQGLLGLAGADLDLEYAHLDPQVYFHHDGDIRRAFVRDDRLDEGRLLGHWLGPNADDLHAALRLPPADWGRLTLEFEQSRWGLVDSLRGADFGFIHVKKDDKAWLVGDRSVERLYRVVWERAGWPGPLAGRVDTSCAVTRVERSGLWPADAAGRVPGSGWQVELGLRWRFDRRLRTTG